ncbi:NlpC/P60 family protein [Alkalihalobacillus deserti]|uniref:NlpC/P60 family protein n=1 Tax=Alkalihalobacillus deserti TaxID=2879466 RepID=UPI001D146030|nr:NlpC/P60 family protein [Alkalihalobacillus deserti]
MRKLRTWLLALGIATMSVVSVEIMTPNQVQAQSLQDKIVVDSQSLVGTPYVYGGTTTRGFDCSGFLNYVFSKNGISLPRTAAAIYAAGDPIERKNLQNGDLVFFQTYKPGASHAGIYIGNNQFIHASSSRGVMVSSLNDSYWSQRYIGNRTFLDQTTRSSLQAEDMVANAERQARSLKNHYMVTSIDQVQISSAFEQSYNVAKDAVSHSQALNLSANQVNKINEADELILRAARFFDGVRTGDQLVTAQNQLRVFIDNEVINGDMEKAYDSLSSEIRRTERAIGRVYGPEPRQLVGDKFVLPAKIARETVIWEMTRYKLLKEMDAQLDRGELNQIEDDFALLNRLERRSVEIKKAGNALHPGSYPDLPEMEAYLKGLRDSVQEKYETIRN